MIEISVVVLISLIVGMIAIPNMVSVIANARLHAGVTSMSGLLQSCRMEAVKKNETLTTHFDEDEEKLVGWVKPVAAAPLPRLATDLQAQWEAPVKKWPSPTGVGAPTAISTSILGFTPMTDDPSFNTRGLPCAWNGTTCVNNGFLYYFNDTSRHDGQGWAALSISPAGRIKKWFWTGSAWVD
ncbi:MAG TPA: hypothetical protein VFR18_14440 [Terriglobia bacterium]|nr:hypothetical protein [Terriglobia bacterium]